MFLVVAMKSRTFSSFSYSANEQVCRSWEGAQTDSQASQWKYSILQMSCSVYEWGLAGGKETTGFSDFWESESSLGWEFKLFLGL